MAFVVDVCLDCNGRINILGYNESGGYVYYCGTCGNYLHPHEVVKRYV